MDFNGYTKDLSSVCQDLSSIFIVDNSPAAYRGNPGEFSCPGMLKMLRIVTLMFEGGCTELVKISFGELGSFVMYRV